MKLWFHAHTFTHLPSFSSRQTQFPLPHDVIIHTFEYLDRISIQQCSRVCKVFKSATDCIYPGLKLRLYPHQINSGETYVYVCVNVYRRLYEYKNVHECVCPLIFIYIYASIVDG